MSRYRLPVLVVLALVLTGLAYANGSFRLPVDPGATLGPRLTLGDFAATPYGRYLAIWEAALAADREVADAIREAPEEQKRTELLRRRTTRRAFGDQFLALARELGDDPEAGDAVVDALTWVVLNCPQSPQGREAVERLMDGSIRSARMSDVCLQLDAEESPIAEPVFRAVLASSPHPLARARSALGLARSLRRRSEQVAPSPGTAVPPEVLASEAECLYEEAVAKYGDLRVGEATLAELAEPELFELRNLGIGHRAPEIDGPDLRGEPMALSDFRGKVVVLEFWGHWCTLCQAMYPYERALVERLQGQPFVLLGVNSDDPRTGATVARQERIAPRSWSDGGAIQGGLIAQRWNVKALPTTYVLDHRGVIRYKFGPRADGHDLVREVLDPSGSARNKWELRAARIADAVDQLLAEAARELDPAPASPTP
jgi:peroxiredoxin